MQEITTREEYEEATQKLFRAFQFIDDDMARQEHATVGAPGNITTAAKHMWNVIIAYSFAIWIITRSFQVPYASLQCRYIPAPPPPAPPPVPPPVPVLPPVPEQLRYGDELVDKLVFARDLHIYFR